MAISGISTFELTASQVISEAFDLIGVRSNEQPIQANETADGIRHLNLLLKTLSAKDLHIWMKREGVIFLNPGTESYNLSTTGDRACYIDDFVSTTTTSAISSGVAVIPVSSSSGMAVGDQVGIKVSATSRVWSTILTVDSSTQITLNDNLTANVSSGASVFTFTDKIDRPMRVLSVRRTTFNVDSTIPVLVWSRQQYFDQVNKESQGTVISYYYSPQLTNGKFYVWQTASNVDQFLKVTFYKQLDDITDQSQTLEIPQEWQEAIVYALAARLGITYGCDAEQYNRVISAGGTLMEQIEEWDQEQGNLFIQPNYMGQQQ